MNSNYKGTKYFVEKEYIDILKNKNIIGFKNDIMDGEDNGNDKSSDESGQTKDFSVFAGT